MKRKSVPAPDPVIPREILEQAKKCLPTDKFRAPVKCSVCNGEVAPNSTEGLCWICRRLKISAWHDSDQQMGAQE